MGEATKRIAVLIGQADESYQKRFMSGLTKQAFADDMDVCVFSMYRKYQDSVQREKGEANIYALFNPDKFDGVVMLKDTIQTEGVAEELEEKLHNEFGGPVLVIEKESEYFDSVSTDGYTAVREMVTHLIEVHGYTKLAFLTGKKWHPHSIRRLDAFRDCLSDHGLEVNEDWIVYGDFWYNSGELCADHIISLNDELPEVIVCANDAMAIGLCEALEKRNVKIPEDIAIASYDSTDEGQTSPVTITSADIPAYELGEYSMEYMRCRFKGEEPPAFSTVPKLLIGESCGCKEGNMPTLTIRRSEWATETSQEGIHSINNMMNENLLMQDNLMDFLSMLHTYAYQIKGAKSFHLCLCSPWRYIDGNADDEDNNNTKSSDAAPSIHVKNDGYPEQMIYAIKYSSNKKDNHVGLSEMFSVKDMLPELYEDRDEPRAYFFTPVFFEEECYGYGVVSYGSNARSYDEIYRLWIAEVSRAFESLRRSCVLRSVTTLLDNMHVSKFDLRNIAYESLSDEEKEEYKMTKRILDENLLTYHFQPIVRARDGSIYSFEALMRPTTDKWISPLSIIRYASMMGRLSDVERATFINILSRLDNDRESFGHSKVFINSIPGVKLSGVDYGKVKELLSKYSDVAVVELTEEAELSDADLNELKDYFNSINVETAVDDYGTGYSNVSNLLRYMPNYVKIDRSLLSEIQNKPQKQHFVREIIEFCHDNNIIALAEGIETAEELRMVIHLGADLIQGYYTGKPSAEVVKGIDKMVLNQIRAYYQEKIDGIDKEIYVAGKTNRISLNTLQKNGVTDIIVGAEGMVYKDIAIIGTPGVKSGIHMRIEPDYIGRITLENAYLSNVKNRPCIEIAAGADVTLVLSGDNELYGSGIQVLKDSRLVIEGDGNLKIDLNSPEYYGIGNDLSSANGELVFEQDGIITINTTGKNGICIGSGLGGVITIDKGHYILRTNGEESIGIGAFNGDMEMNIDSCLIEIDLVATQCVGVGSYNGNAKVEFNRSALNCVGGGNKTVGIGTLNGKSCEIVIRDSGMGLDMRGVETTCIGALYGSSVIDAAFVGLRLENGGSKALALGGYSEDTHIKLISADVVSKVHNSLGVDTYASKDNFKLVDGRKTFKVNDIEVDRKLEYS